MWNNLLHSSGLWPIDHCIPFHLPNDIHLLHEEYLLQSPLHSWNHQAIVIYLYHFSAPHGVALQNVHRPARVLHLHHVACHYAIGHHNLPGQNAYNYHGHGHGRTSTGLHKLHHWEIEKFHHHSLGYSWTVHHISHHSARDEIQCHVARCRSILRYTFHRSQTQIQISAQVWPPTVLEAQIPQ